MRTTPLAALAVVLALTACSETPSPSQSGFAAKASGDPVQILVLSNRADILSGGDTLVEVLIPATADASKLKLDVDGRDVTDQVQLRDNGRIMGVVSGLNLGDNKLTAQLPDGSGAFITLSNHPIGGPVFSGPQIQPWTCNGGDDAQCNRAPVYTYQYKRTASGSFETYNPDSPPAQVATTTTDQGKTVPFIVRVETGRIDRDEYRIAALYDPAKPDYNAWDARDGFNNKIVIFHGASCDTAYTMAAAPDVMNAVALGRGFITMSHALNNAGHNCNIATQAESMVMTKEYLIERYGEVRYTIGSGCSGGALAQQQVANAYPGFFQGITPACSFTDAWSSSQQYIDYTLLRNYFEKPETWGLGVVWDPLARAAVEGHPNPVNSVTFTTAIPNSGDPSRSCPGVPAADVFNETTNPTGVRCSLQDYMVNLFGRRAEDGYAQRPFDNVGIQYGFKGLMAGTVSPAQFVDFNSKLKAYDINGNFVDGRLLADRPALGYLYRTGAINTATNLDQTAIIDLRGPDPGAFHDVYRTYVMRARLQRNFGTVANQLLWRGNVALLGDANYTGESIVAMDSWLGAVEQDLRTVPVAQKLLENLPADVADRCTDGAGNDVPQASCDAVVQAYSSPRIEAGMPLTDDVMKCELKPLVRTDYLPIVFTDAQWATLQSAFPDGVCDYSKPAVDFTPTVPWLSYKAGPGGVALGTAPVSLPLGAVLAAAPAATADNGRFGSSAFGLHSLAGLLLALLLGRPRRKQ